jgi:hypothetical protein
MVNSGMMGMPLHFGKVPRWLTERMGKMGSAIIESVAQNYGKSEVLTRLSNPNWFQAFGAVTGMHWNSSGVTATVLGSLKRKINPMANELGIYILGGKGKYSYYAPNQHAVSAGMTSPVHLPSGHACLIPALFDWARSSCTCLSHRVCRCQAHWPLGLFFVLASPILLQLHQMNSSAFR